MTAFTEAEKLLNRFKGNTYTFGPGVLDKIGKVASSAGRRALLFRGTFPGSNDYVKEIEKSLERQGVELISVLKGAKPNSPREDVGRIREDIKNNDPGLIISFGGGSTIDAVKASIVLASLGGHLDDYIGMEKVSKAMEQQGKNLIPHIASQTLAGSGAHLTKYSNITDIKTSQKKLLIDDAIIPAFPIFDYSMTYNTPSNIIADGALDGLFHLIEVLYSTEGRPFFDLAFNIAAIGMDLIIKYLPEAIATPDDHRAREGLCLGTDLGGYAIMTGGTNGGHLTSFSLVDILSHGRACAIMNPYYAVFFAPAIERSLKLICTVFSKYGYAGNSFKRLSGRPLGIYAAKTMISFAENIGFPTTLGEIEGFTKNHIDRVLMAARDPELSSKLQNMPVPMTVDMIDHFMRKVLESAASGKLDIIENAPDQVFPKHL